MSRMSISRWMWLTYYHLMQSWTFRRYLLPILANGVVWNSIHRFDSSPALSAPLSVNTCLLHLVLLIALYLSHNSIKFYQIWHHLTHARSPVLINGAERHSKYSHLDTRGQDRSGSIKKISSIFFFSFSRRHHADSRWRRHLPLGQDRGTLQVSWWNDLPTGSLLTDWFGFALQGSFAHGRSLDDGPGRSDAADDAEPLQTRWPRV